MYVYTYIRVRSTSRPLKIPHKTVIARCMKRTPGDKTRVVGAVKKNSRLNSYGGQKNWNSFCFCLSFSFLHLLKDHAAAVIELVSVCCCPDCSFSYSFLGSHHQTKNRTRKGCYCPLAK